MPYGQVSIIWTKQGVFALFKSEMTISKLQGRLMRL